MLHGDSSSKSDLKQNGNKLRPIDQPLARDAITPPAFAANADLLQNRLDDFGILRMNRNDSVPKIPSRLDGIDELTHKVGWIEFQAIAVVWYQSE